MSVDEIRWGPWLDDVDRILEGLSESNEALAKDKSNEVAIDNVKMMLHSVKGLLDSVGLKITTQTVAEIEENIYNEKIVSDDLFKQLKSLFKKLGKLIDHIRTEKPKTEDINELDKLMGFESILVKFGTDYELEISIKGEKSLRSARALGILNTMKRIGRIKTSEPNEEDLYLDTKFDTLKIILSTRESAEQITEDVNKIPHVSSVIVNRITEREDVEKFSIESLSLKIPLVQIRQLENSLATLSTHIESLKHEISTTRGYEELVGIDTTFERLRNDLKKMRKVPFDSIVSPLTTMTSRLAQNEGKQIDLTIQGRFVTLDRAIANYLIDPITQILRNGVIHGIEKVMIRRKAKKHFIGKILLSAINDRDKIKIRIIDDGRGIDDKELLKAAKKDNIPTDHLKTYEDRIELIFEKGISLSKSDKKLAGRGIGLYGAKERIKQFGGSLSVSSEKGKGTTFTIEFIDQDALSKNLIISVNNENYAIPSSEVEKVELIEGSDLDQTSDTGAVYEYNDEKLPVAILKNIIGAPTPIDKKKSHIMVITRGYKSLLGIIVDSLLDERLVNVKPLNPILQSYKLFNGTLIGRNKEVILVVNPAAII